MAATAIWYGQYTGIVGISCQQLCFFGKSGDTTFLQENVWISAWQGGATIWQRFKLRSSMQVLC